MVLLSFAISEKQRGNLGVILCILNLVLAALAEGILFTTYDIQKAFKEKDLLVKDLHLQLILNIQITIAASIIIVHLPGAKLCHDCGYWWTRDRYQHLFYKWNACVFIISCGTWLGVILLLTEQFKWLNYVDEYLKEGMLKYGSNHSYKVQVDHLQNDFHCCGVRNFKDWWKISWLSAPNASAIWNQARSKRSNETENELLPPWSPWSCCNKESLEICESIHMFLPHNIRRTEYGESEEEKPPPPNNTELKAKAEKVVVEVDTDNNTEIVTEVYNKTNKEIKREANILIGNKIEMKRDTTSVNTTISIVDTKNETSNNSTNTEIYIKHRTYYKCVIEWSNSSERYEISSLDENLLNKENDVAGYDSYLLQLNEKDCFGSQCFPGMNTEQDNTTENNLFPGIVNTTENNLFPGIVNTTENNLFPGTVNTTQNNLISDNKTEQIAVSLNHSFENQTEKSEKQNKNLTKRSNLLEERVDFEKMASRDLNQFKNRRKSENTKQISNNELLNYNFQQFRERNKLIPYKKQADSNFLKQKQMEINFETDFKSIDDVGRKKKRKTKKTSKDKEIDKILKRNQEYNKIMEANKQIQKILDQRIRHQRKNLNKKSKNELNERQTKKMPNISKRKDKNEMEKRKTEKKQSIVNDILTNNKKKREKFEEKTATSEAQSNDPGKNLFPRSVNISEGENVTVDLNETKSENVSVEVELLNNNVSASGDTNQSKNQSKLLEQAARQHDLCEKQKSAAQDQMYTVGCVEGIKLKLNLEIQFGLLFLTLFSQILTYILGRLLQTSGADATGEDDTTYGYVVGEK